MGGDDSKGSAFYRHGDVFYARSEELEREEFMRGEAQGRQVEDARVALTHLVGGGSIATVNLLGVERS